jgi:hypothetical protein
LRIISHSGLAVVSSPSNSASGQSSAAATCASTSTETLPSPLSRFARCRSDTSAAAASTRRGIPRRARSSFTRWPSASSSGAFSLRDCGRSMGESSGDMNYIA